MPQDEVVLREEILGLYHANEPQLHALDNHCTCHCTKHKRRSNTHAWHTNINAYQAHICMAHTNINAYQAHICMAHTNINVITHTNGI